MPTARRSAAAERDLQGIAYHIALKDGRPLAADRVIDAMVGQAEEIAPLSANSVAGTAAPEIGDGVRLPTFMCAQIGDFQSLELRGDSKFCFCEKETIVKTRQEADRRR